MSLWFQSFPTPLEINKMAFAHTMNPDSYELNPRRQSTDQMFRYSQQFVQRPGSSCSIGSNSSESTVIPPIHNRNYQESRYKTELCRHWQENGTCPHGMQCLFAHGLNELKAFRGRHRKYKTQLCKAFHADGFCSFGPRCSYIHSGVDIVPGAINPIPLESIPPQFKRKQSIDSVDMTACELQNRLNMLSLESPHSLSAPVAKSDVRLSVFANICHN